MISHVIKIGIHSNILTMVSNSAGPRPIRGRFAAKTPTQSKGFPGVQPTETPTSGSSSGTTVQGTKTTATRRTKILQQSLPTLILPFIKIAIFVSAMVIIGLVFFVVIMMVVRNLHAKGAWESHQYPAEVHFSEIAVSTTSQECNEMARVMVSEGFNIFAIAFAMQLCLSLAEPQRSGFGGAATAVLVEGGKKGCQIIDGFWDTRKKKLFKQITEEERMNKLFTTKRLAESILLPSDTSVARFFLGYLDSDEIDRLADFLKMYKLEYQPVRLSLQRAIEYDPLWLLHSKDLARFFKNDEQMRTLKEGDIVESENFGEYFLAQKSYIQNASEFWRGYLVSFFFKDMKTNVWSDDDFPRNKTSRCFSVGGDVTLCAPRRFAKSFSKYASAKSSDEESEHGEKPFIMTEAMRTLKFFEELEKQSKAAKQQRTTQEHHYTERTLEPTKTTERQIPINEVKQKRSVPNVEEKNTTSEEVQLPSTSSSDKASTTTTIKFTTTEQTTTQEKVDYDDDEEEDEDEESVDETSDWKKAPDEMGWDSNMFVIVDRKTDKAIAYSGTLGSRFGSRVLVTQQFLLNNLDEYARKGHYPYNRFNGLFPMIATSNGKIKFAYASVGGSIDDSRSLPRTITSLLLNIFQRQKLSATLGWPLLYSFNGTTYRDGIRAANIFEVLKNRIRLLLQAPNLADESVSIEVLGDKLVAAHKNVKEGFSNIPAGFDSKYYG